MVIHNNPEIIGQAIIGLFFVIAGVNQFFSLNQMKAYASSKGVPAVGIVIPLVATLLAVAGLAILTDPFLSYDLLSLGAGIGILSTAIITVIMHDFWRMADTDDHLMEVRGKGGSDAHQLPPMENEIFHFLKNIALIGGLFLLL